MSRSGYCDDYEHIELYRNAVERAMSGKRGQDFFKKMAKAMDDMPEKKLITGRIIDKQGLCCAMGTVFKAEGIDVSKVDYNDRDEVAKLINIAPSMAAEIAYMNDEWSPSDTPEQRWVRIRAWIDENLKTSSL